MTTFTDPDPNNTQYTQTELTTISERYKATEKQTNSNVVSGRRRNRVEEHMKPLSLLIRLRKPGYAESSPKQHQRHADDLRLQKKTPPALSPCSQSVVPSAGGDAPMSMHEHDKTAAEIGRHTQEPRPAKQPEASRLTRRNRAHIKPKSFVYG